MEEKKTGLSTNNSSSTQLSAAIIIGALMISLSILISNGVLQVSGGKLLIKSATNAEAVNTIYNSPAPVAAATPDDSAPAQVAVGDAPIIGDKNAKLTMVEFSDYECPFCKRYFEDTWPQLKKDYIDTGKLKVAYRNLPLPFHQNAHKEAEAALCVRDQAGDDVYYKFHDLVFSRTTSNGLGFALDKLAPAAGELGLNTTQFQQCIDSGKYKDKVDKDIADASNIGATGTPTFFIGLSSSNGVISGQRLVGAQPYSAFKAQLDSLLK
jgi:protein-disulfide isomerase